jgi:hypothetical protein
VFPRQLPSMATLAARAAPTAAAPHRALSSRRACTSIPPRRNSSATRNHKGGLTAVAAAANANDANSAGLAALQPPPNHITIATMKTSQAAAPAPPPFKGVFQDKISTNFYVGAAGRAVAVFPCYLSSNKHRRNLYLAQHSSGLRKRLPHTALPTAFLHIYQTCSYLKCAHLSWKHVSCLCSLPAVSALVGAAIGCAIGMVGGSPHITGGSGAHYTRMGSGAH